MASARFDNYRLVPVVKERGYPRSRPRLMEYWIIPLLILVALMKPSGFEDIPWMSPVNLLFTGIQVCSLFYALWLYLLQPISRLLVLTSVIYLLYSFPVAIQGNYDAMLSSESFNLIKIIAIIMLSECYISRGCGKVLVRGFAYGASLLLVANLLFTFVLNPGGLYSDFSDGIYDECFLGNKNTVRNPLLIGFACSSVLDALNNRRTSSRTIGLIIIGITNLALVWSATALVVFSVSCVFYFLSLAGAHIPKVKYFVLSAAVSWFAVVVFRRVDLFQNFVVDALQKDMTFSGRTTMWDCAFNQISQSPFLGKGFGSYLTYWNTYNPFLQVPHCHNALVDAMYKGGVLAFLALALLITIACLKLQHVTDRHIRDCLTIAITSFLFMGIFGELLNPCFLAVLTVASCAERLEGGITKNPANSSLSHSYGKRWTGRSLSARSPGV